MMEAAKTPETLVNFYQTTRRYNPEDSHLRTHRRENLKSNLPIAQMVYTAVPDSGLSFHGIFTKVLPKLSDILLLLN
jgi:hypothetical protein